MHTNFVIGATGYIGGKLFNSSKEIGKTIGTSSKGGDCFLKLNLDQINNFNFNLINKGDIVYFLAAISSPDICMNEYHKAKATNVIGTVNFIENAILRGARIIFFSSDAVYGERSSNFDETAVCNPAGEYAEMKHEVEQYFTGNDSFKSIRLSYVFSKDDKFTQYLVACIESNQHADLFHPFFRSIVHRDDVVEGAFNLASRWNDFPNQNINFGGPQVLSRIDFALCLHKNKHSSLRYKISEPSADFFKNRPRVIAMSSPVFAKLLGRAPRTLFDASIIEFSPLK